MKIDGGCHCGYITYEAEADPDKTSICHCTDCQHLTGTAFPHLHSSRGRQLPDVLRRADDLCEDGG
jgi:hypothetical protein